MKISKEQKEQNRREIIKACVDQVIERGLKGATMRGIARSAGVGDATVYNYFPTKEAIYYAYFEDCFAEAADQLESMEGIDEFSLRERLQGLFEALLEAFLPDREFVEAVFRPVFASLPLNSREIRPAQDHFFGSVQRALEAAEERGELEELMFKELVVRFFWDYFIGVTAYWLRDGSEQFSDTSLLIDKSMDLGCSVLRAGVVGKAFDIASFLFRNHVLAHLGNCRENMDMFKQIQTAFLKNDREGEHERENTGR